MSDAGSTNELDSTTDAEAGIAEIQSYIDTYYYADSDIRHSFLDRAGKQVDCIDFGAQWSVKHLASKGLQPPPPPPQPSLPPEMPTVLMHSAFLGEPDQNGSARQCPDGTIPKYRPTVAQILAAGGLQAYISPSSRPGRLQSCSPYGQTTFEHDCYDYGGQPASWELPPNNVTGLSYEHAVGINDGHLEAGAAPPFWGMSAVTSVYSVYVTPETYEHADDQIWLQTGTCENWFNGSPDSQECTTGSGGNAVQSFEVAVFQAQGAAGETYPTLQIFWTPDGYYTGCYAGSATGACCDNGGLGDCWVQYSSVATPGMPLVYGYIGDTPEEFGIQAWQGAGYHSYDAGWWVWAPGVYVLPDGGTSTVGGSSPIGMLLPDAYVYPGTSVQGPMATGAATYMQIGGEVYDTWPSGLHTQTQMGSGYGPGIALGYKNEAYFRDICTIAEGGGYAQAYFENFYPDVCNDYDSLGDTYGVCGPQSQYWPPTSGSYGFGGYAVDIASAAGGSGWDTYFYFGGGVGVCNLSGGCPP